MLLVAVARAGDLYSHSSAALLSGESAILEDFHHVAHDAVVPSASTKLRMYWISVMQ